MTGCTMRGGSVAIFVGLFLGTCILASGSSAFPSAPASALSSAPAPAAGEGGKQEAIEEQLLRHLDSYQAYSDHGVGSRRRLRSSEGDVSFGKGVDAKTSRHLHQSEGGVSFGKEANAKSTRHLHRSDGGMSFGKVAGVKSRRHVQPPEGDVFAEKEDHWPGLGQATEWDPMDMASGDLIKIDKVEWESRAKMYLKDRPEGKRHLAFHWAVISCEREGLMRTLGTAILTSLAHEMGPASITIIWCKPYNASTVPSLFHNIRFSRKIRVLYLPDKLQRPDLQGKFQKNQVAFMRALSVPKYLGMPKLPILVTEDDVMFIPDFNARLSSAVNTIHKFLGPAPRPNYLINLYRPYPYGTMPGPELAHWYEREWNGTYPKYAGAITVTTGEDTFHFGAQAVFFSPMMASRMMSHLADVLYRKYRAPASFTDMLILDFLQRRFKCWDRLPRSTELDSKTQDAVAGSGRRCISFRIAPCMVQHTGIVSSVFQTASANSRFHIAETFPYKIAWPSHDAPSVW